MLHGPARAAVDRGEDDRLALVPLVVCLALVVVLGVVVPSPLARLLVMSAEILSR